MKKKSKRERKRAASTFNMKMNNMENMQKK